MSFLRAAMLLSMRPREVAAMGKRAAQSTVTLATLITAAHFSTSAGSMAATSAGVLSATGST